MIAFGEERFTPAKKSGTGSGALDSHAIPRGQSAAAILFHYSLRRFAHGDRGAGAGGSTTRNTAGMALILAAALLRQDKPDMTYHHDHRWQPSALTLETDACTLTRLRLDPLVISRTLDKTTSSESVQEARPPDPHVSCWQGDYGW